MGQKLVKLRRNLQEFLWCVWENDALFPLQKNFSDYKDLVTQPRGKKLAIQDQNPLSLAPLSYCAPITGAPQIICQGKNYLAHLLETGVKPENKEYNLLFTKAPSSLADPIGSIVRPEGIELLDYEIELGIVLRRTLNSPAQITERNFLEFVGALVMANDVSARDVQVPQRQWFKGKSYRGFCPVGPVLYLLGEEDLQEILDLNLELLVNGKVRQKANTRQLMYTPFETLSEISRIFDLYPGDLVLTGTPGGVAMKIEKSFWSELAQKFLSENAKMESFLQAQRRNPRYLKNGDEIRSWICSSSQRIDLGEQRLLVTGRSPA